MRGAPVGVDEWVRAGGGMAWPRSRHSRVQRCSRWCSWACSRSVLCSCLARFRVRRRWELAVSTDPIALYVVENGKVEERRSGVGPAWSPDGRRLAYKGDFDGRIWVDDRPFLLDVGIGGEVQWTPDGRSLLFEGNGIRLLDRGRERIDSWLRAWRLPCRRTEKRWRTCATGGRSAPGSSLGRGSSSCLSRGARLASSRGRAALSPADISSAPAVAPRWDGCRDRSTGRRNGSVGDRAHTTRRPQTRPRASSEPGLHSVA